MSDRARFTITSRTRYREGVVAPTSCYSLVLRNRAILIRGFPARKYPLYIYIYIWEHWEHFTRRHAESCAFVSRRLVVVVVVVTQLHHRKQRVNASRLFPTQQQGRRRRREECERVTNYILAKFTARELVANSSSPFVLRPATYREILYDEKLGLENRLIVDIHSNFLFVSYMNRIT